LFNQGQQEYKTEVKQKVKATVEPSEEELEDIVLGDYE
jgi:hypothetical protein